ncbi:MAG: hypothetical protein ABSD74_18390 [Rhizomicrobium sp.]|jgi:uncharacterized lipoprotein
MKLGLAAAAAALAIALTGCSTAPIPVDYAPSSTLSASGSVQVADFKYMPAISGKMKPNQIHNTAMGSVLLDKNVDAFYRNAVFTELRFVGVSVGGGNKQLTGTINEFLIDDLGYSVDWTVDVDYVVKDANGTVLYEADKLTKNHTAKFANAFVALNMQIKSNIEALISDPAFIKAIH